MTTGELFPPSTAERRDRLRRFVLTELAQRERMVERHPNRREYWLDRIAEAHQALADIKALEETNGT